MKNSFTTLLAATLLAGICQTTFAQGTTAITYQGRLNTDTGSASGNYDLRFSVYDANVAGNFVAGPVTNAAVAVSNGLFTAMLDFGSKVFTGTNYWVEMGVRTNGGGSFITLVPRQQLTPAPYALSLALPQATALNPPGAVIAFAGSSIPVGYLVCDGSAVSRTTYSNLFAAIGIGWGSGNGSTTFNLPDMRGLFLRGVDGGAGRDPDSGSRTIPLPGGNTGNAVGSYQPDIFAAHSHRPSSFAVNQTTSISPNASTWYVDTFGPAPTVDNAPNTGSAGGNETRPKNCYVNYMIKY